MTERRLPLSDEDVEKIAAKIAERTREAFYIEEEKHYNSHQKLDSLLQAYESASNIFAKTFIALTITGAMILAGLAVKDWK